MKSSEIANLRLIVKKGMQGEGCTSSSLIPLRANNVTHHIAREHNFVIRYIFEHVFSFIENDEIDWYIVFTFIKKIKFSLEVIIKIIKSSCEYSIYRAQIFLVNFHNENCLANIENILIARFKCILLENIFNLFLFLFLGERIIVLTMAII